MEERDVAVRMRDGVTLRADLYRPDSASPLPGLLLRTPYDKRRCDFGRETFRPVARAAAAAGYVVAVQDVRGRFASEGTFVPFFSPGHREDLDGYDSVEWLAALPACDGRVGTFGDSYGAWLQWELARTKPPSLVAMLPSGLPATALDHPILRVGRRVLWAIARMAPDTQARSEGVPTGPTTADAAYTLWDDHERGKWYWFLPWSELPDWALGGLAPYFHALLDRMPVDYLAPQRDWGAVDVPALHLTGWFDIDVGGSIAHYTGMVESAGSARARANQRLVIGPWTHMDPFYELPSTHGELDFGPDAARDYAGLLVDWFDRQFGRVPGEAEPESGISYFVMGANTWRHSHAWPPPGVTELELYLDSATGANTASGDGRLAPEPVVGSPPDTYAYDPRDPVMSIYDKDAYYAPLDQAPLDHRRDVLVYRSEPLDRALEVVGPVRVELWAASSAADTDFSARLVDESPDGRALGISSGLVRARYRDGVENPALLEPGAPYQFTIELLPTAYRYEAGHRIRLQIASSDFPDYDRNHNTGADDLRDPRLVTAHQSVFHDDVRPSRLVLSVVA